MSASPANVAPTGVRWHFTTPALLFVIVAIGIAVVPFINALSQLVDLWNISPEYSHGILIPPIAALLVWRQREWLARTPFEGAWTGLLVVGLGLLLWLVGEYSTIITIVHYGFLLVLYGLIAALTGWKVFRRLWMPLLILVFMIPLPAFFANTLSLKLQLLSSAIGVWIIRLFGISVFLEGNVIDLGSYQLQVAEACDGLRYLFPLMTLAFILSYFFRAPLWKRLVLFVASVPIAILMNSFRIGAIGVTVEHWGRKMAEGLLHDFEGWAVFMLSTAVLLGVAALIVRMGSPKTTLRDALSFDLGSRAGEPEAPGAKRTLAKSFVTASILVATASVMAFAMPPRDAEALPARKSLVEFPTHVGTWQGRRQPLEDVYLDALKLDDYLMADYRDGAGVPVNFYVAYYDSQRKGHSVHSPRSCLPGGGWVMRSFERTNLSTGGGTVPANRVVIELGRNKQIVYYWFQQRGRTITNEYLVKWYIFWDSLTRNRSDGALVRLVAPVPTGADEARVDAELARFAAIVTPNLSSYIPD